MWTAVSFGAIAAWKYREAIARKFSTSPTIVFLKGAESDEITGTLHAISAASSGSSDATATLTVGSERTALWNIEAPTPSLARRLEELAAWYLHVS